MMIQVSYRSHFPDPTTQTASSLLTPYLYTVVITSMKAAMIAGLANPNISLSDIGAICPTGNCTFPTYTSLSICAVPADITLQLSTSGNLTLPNSVYLKQTSDFYLNITTLTNSTLVFENATNTLASVYVVRSGPTIQAMEIMLQFCVQEYRTKVVLGSTTTELLSSHNDSAYAGPLLTLRGPGDDQRFTVPDSARMPLARALADLFSGAAASGGSHSRSSDAAEAMVATGDGLINMVRPVEQVALAMTNSMRSGSMYNRFNNFGGIAYQDRKPDTAPAPGTAYRGIAHLQVVWGWVALPAVLLAVTVLFLTVVAWESRKMMVGCLKSSSLAVLAGLGEQARSRLDGLDRASSMEDCAKTMEVSLQHRGDGAGWHLELRDSPPASIQRDRFTPAHTWSGR
jgi:hypothetical protein